MADGQRDLLAFDSPAADLLGLHAALQPAPARTQPPPPPPQANLLDLALPPPASAPLAAAAPAAQPLPLLAAQPLPLLAPAAASPFSPAPASAQLGQPVEAVGRTFNFNEFLEKMRQPGSYEIVRQIKRSVTTTRQ